MTERPILFSAPMVRALLAGTKTQTRRVAIKTSQPHNVYPCDFDATECKIEIENQHSGQRHWLACPYGQPGDRLWVRENGWERPERTPKMMREGADTWARYYYDADGITQADAEDFKRWGFKRRPSIHMPRWASRITLEITSVRVERLQNISRGDAMGEGCPFQNMAQGGDPRQWYAQLWERLNGTGSWAANPWVWAIEFRKVAP